MREMAATNSSIALYVEQPFPSTPEGRAELYKYLSSFRHGYRIQSLTFSGNTAAAEVSVESTLYRPELTFHSNAICRYELSKNNTHWEVTKRVLIIVSDGYLVQ